MVIFHSYVSLPEGIPNVQSSITGITGSFFHGIFVLRHPLKTILAPDLNSPQMNSPHPQGDISHDWKSSHAGFCFMEPCQKPTANVDLSLHVISIQ